jgi:hypothetical protein
MCPISSLTASSFYQAMSVVVALTYCSTLMLLTQMMILCAELMNMTACSETLIIILTNVFFNKFLFSQFLLISFNLFDSIFFSSLSILNELSLQYLPYFLSSYTVREVWRLDVLPVLILDIELRQFTVQRSLDEGRDVLGVCSVRNVRWLEGTLGYWS